MEKKTIRQLAALLNISVEQLAILAGIDPARLKAISEGRAVMLARELCQLAHVTGVSMYEIMYETEIE